MATGQLKAGKRMGPADTYPPAKVDRIKQRFLYHRVLNYHPKCMIYRLVATELGITVEQVKYLLQRERMV